jgi:hypothetical protein
MQIYSIIYSIVILMILGKGSLQSTNLATPNYFTNSNFKILKVYWMERVTRVEKISNTCKKFRKNLAPSQKRVLSFQLLFILKKPFEVRGKYVGKTLS